MTHPLRLGCALGLAALALRSSYDACGEIPVGVTLAVGLLVVWLLNALDRGDWEKSEKEYWRRSRLETRIELLNPPDGTDFVLAADREWARRAGG